MRDGMETEANARLMREAIRIVENSWSETSTQELQDGAAQLEERARRLLPDGIDPIGLIDLDRELSHGLSEAIFPLQHILAGETVASSGIMPAVRRVSGAVAAQGGFSGQCTVKVCFLLLLFCTEAEAYAVLTSFLVGPLAAGLYSTAAVRRDAYERFWAISGAPDYGPAGTVGRAIESLLCETGIPMHTLFEIWDAAFMQGPHHLFAALAVMATVPLGDGKDGTMPPEKLPEEAAALTQEGESFHAAHVLPLLAQATQECVEHHEALLVQACGPPHLARGSLREWLCLDLGPPWSPNAAGMSPLGHVRPDSVAHNGGLSSLVRRLSTGLQTPLMLACGARNLGLVQDLLERPGAIRAVRSTARDGSTALHFAAEAGDAKLVAILLDAGGLPGTVDGGGYTPLHCAAIGGSLEVLQVLLSQLSPMERRGVLSAANVAGLTALHCAATVGSSRCSAMLIDARADVHAGDSQGAVPLHWAARCGHTETAHILRAGGTRVDGRAGDAQWTPLHLAAEAGHARTAQMLLQLAADADGNTATVDAMSATGVTPLALAAANRDITLCKILLLCGSTVPGAKAEGDAGWMELVLQEPAGVAVAALRSALARTDKQRLASTVQLLLMQQKPGQNAEEQLQKTVAELQAATTLAEAKAKVEHGAAIANAVLNHVVRTDTIEGQAPGVNNKAILSDILGLTSTSSEEEWDAFEAAVTEAVEGWCLERIHRPSFEALLAFHTAEAGIDPIEEERRARWLSRCTQESFQVSEELRSPSGWEAAIAALQVMGSTVKVTTKIDAVSRMARLIEETAKAETEKKQAATGQFKQLSLGADEQVPIICYCVAHAKLRHLAAQADYIKSSFLAYHQPFGRIEYDVSMLYGAVDYICRLAEDAEADSVPEMLQTPGSRRPQLNVDEPGSPLREVSSLGSIVSLDSGLPAKPAEGDGAGGEEAKRGDGDGAGGSLPR